MLDGIKYAGVGTSLLLAFFFYYYAPSFAMVWRLAILFSGILLSGALFLLSSKGKVFVRFCVDAWREMDKVVWPEYKQAIHLALIVVLFVAIVSLYLWLSDSLVRWVLYDLVLGWD